MHLHFNTAAHNTHSLHELGACQLQPRGHLTVKEIAEAQETDPKIHKLTKDPQYTRQLVENTQVLCKGTAIVFPTAL